MKKYRVRTKIGRVIGPFLEEQILELYQKNKLEGNEEVQVFPVGDWKKITTYSEFQHLDFLKTADGSNESTLVKKLNQFENKNEDIKQKAEVHTSKTGIAESIKSTDQEIVKEFGTSTSKDTSNLKPFDYKSSQTRNEIVVPAPASMMGKAKENLSHEKTQINKSTQDYLKELKENPPDPEAHKAIEAQIEDEEEEKINPEATQFISLEQLKNVKSEYDEEEHRKKETSIESEPKKSNLKKIILGVAVLAGVFLFLDPQPKPKEIKITPIPPEISFPEVKEIADPKKADDALKKYVALNAKYDYKSYVKSANLLNESLSNQFENSPAIGKLLNIYGELIRHSNKKIKDGSLFYDLTQIAEPKIYTDAEVVSGIASFYRNFGKQSAAIKLIEQYLAIPTNKPSKELFGVYLDSLVDQGNLEKAKQVFEKLEEVRATGFLIHKSMYNYEKMSVGLTNSEPVLKKYLDLYPESVYLLLEKIAMDLLKEDFKSIEEGLAKILALEAESSPLYYAKYLNYSAFIIEKKGDKLKSEEMVKESLSVIDSDEVRDLIASLYSKSGSSDNLIVQESKAIAVVKKSEQALLDNKLDEAITLAIEATEIAPNSLYSKIQLSRVQIKQGNYQLAIDTLRGLYKNSPNDQRVAFALLDAYLVSYKLQDANKLISILSNSTMNEYPEFSKLVSRYYILKENPSNGQAWIKKAINANPLDDSNYFALARLYIKNKKFEDAKTQLTKAIKLDPQKVEYRVAYASILYELNDTDTAVGYLRDILVDFPDHPKVLSDIGIYYYKSGQSKAFDEIKEILLKMDNASVPLYRFLIKASELDQRTDEMIEYGQKLILMDPSDLETRMLLAKTFIEKEKFPEALQMIRDVESKLDSFPKVNFYYSKLYLLTKDFAKAIDYAKKETEANPDLEDGYVLLGNIQFEQEAYSDAENNYKKAQKLNANSIGALMGLAQVSFKRGQLEIALELFKKALKLQPENASLHKYLGDVYRQIGQGSQAVESYKVFLELDPNSSYKSQIENYIKMLQ